MSPAEINSACIKIDPKPCSHYNDIVVWYSARSSNKYECCYECLSAKEDTAEFLLLCRDAGELHRLRRKVTVVMLLIAVMSVFACELFTVNL